VTPVEVIVVNIKLLPNATERVFVPVEIKRPVDKLNPFKSKVPEVNVVEFVAPTVKAVLRVVVPVWLIIKLLIVLPLLVIEPVPSIVGLKVVYVVLPVEGNIKLLQDGEPP
jgi:hypothetical protein